MIVTYGRVWTYFVPEFLLGLYVQQQPLFCKQFVVLFCYSGRSNRKKLLLCAWNAFPSPLYYPTHFSLLSRGSKVVWALGSCILDPSQVNNRHNPAKVNLKLSPLISMGKWSMHKSLLKSMGLAIQLWAAILGLRLYLDIWHVECISMGMSRKPTAHNWSSSMGMVCSNTEPLICTSKQVSSTFLSVC